MKLQVKENSEASLLDPTFPNVMEEIQSKIFARLPPHLTIVSYIEGDEDSNVSSY